MNTIKWYICPYDTSRRDGRLTRRIAMHRHVPVSKGPTGEAWDGWEIMNGHALVKLLGSATSHANAAADEDITELPIAGDSVRLTDQAAIRTVLEGLGYTSREVTDTEFLGRKIHELTLSARSPVDPNEGLTAFVISSGRKAGHRPPKNAGDRITEG